MKILIGTNDLKNPVPTSTQSLEIKGVHLHPNFSYFYPDFENDIALIELEKEIQWSPSVQPVCLSKSGDKGVISAREEEGTGRSPDVVVAGWGVHLEDQPGKIYEDIMMTSDQELLSVTCNLECF